MNLERFIAALGPGEVVNGAPAGAASVEISDLAYDTRTVTPGALFFCVRGRNADGHAFARDRGGARRGRARRRAARRRSTLPQLVVADVRAAMPVAATLFFGDPSRELAVAGDHRHEREDDDRVPAARDPRGRGRQTGLLTNIERRVGGEPRPTGLNTPEAIDLQRLLRRDGRRAATASACSRRPRRRRRRAGSKARGSPCSSSRT